MVSIPNSGSEPQISCYEYPGQPLDTGESIRLLELQPGNAEDPVAVRLFTTDLHGAPSYEALSYTWGDSRHRKPIQVSHTSKIDVSQQVAEQGSVYPVSVTLNCYAALVRLRKGAISPRTIWIDSLCINQAEVSERNHQVALMTRIYGGADRVVIFLGGSAERSDEAMEWIRELHAPSDYGDVERKNKPRPWEPDMAILEALFRRSWFHRVWVLQEVQMAQKAIVYCGDSSVDWECFDHFKSWNTSTKWLPKLPRVLGISSRRNVYEKEPAAMLLRELINTRHCQATDPRDKLYAILPLLWQQQQQQQRAEHSAHQYEHLEVDYSLPATQVFVNLAAYLFKSFGLHILRLVEPGQVARSSLTALPSWVPDWTVPETYPRRRGGYFHYPTAVMCFTSKGLMLNLADRNGKNSDWQIVKSLGSNGEERNELRGPGKAVGSIYVTGEKCDIRHDYFPLTQWESLVPAPESPTRTSKDRKSRGGQFWSLLYGDEDTWGWDEVRERILWYDQARDDYSKPKVPMINCLQGMKTSYYIRAKHMFDICDGQRFFVTDTGFIGLAPEWVEVGDSVFVLKDAAVPFVLRAVKGGVPGEERAGGPIVMSLVGDCYVHGAMNREVWGDGKDAEEVIVY